MRTPVGLLWAVIGLACLAAGPLAAQEVEPPTDDDPAAVADAASATDPAAAQDDADAADEQAAGGRTLLKIESDLDSMVTVGLDAPVPLVAGETLTVEVAPGAVRVKAYVTAVPEAKTFVDVAPQAGERQRVRLKMVKAVEELRKIEARDRTYRDIETRLMWPIRDNGVDVDWREAGEFCETLEHGGWEDWRLPTLAELESLEAMWSLRQFKTADPITLTACCSWSSDQIDDDNAWNYNYRFRRPFRGHLRYSLDLRALCVRDGSDEIPENTRRNRRLARREAKEKRREKLRRQDERAAAEAAAAAAKKAEEEAAKESDDGSGSGSSL